MFSLSISIASRCFSFNPPVTAARVCKGLWAEEVAEEEEDDDDDDDEEEDLLSFDSKYNESATNSWKTRNSEEKERKKERNHPLV